MYRKLTVIFAAIFAVISLASCTSSDGTPDSNACDVLGLKARIANGTECSNNNSPVVQVTVLPVEGGVGRCSGTLLTSRHVLTAAHCFNFKEGVASASVLVGSADFPASAITLHPAVNFETIPIQNDVAIMTLAIPTSTPGLPIILSRGIVPGDTISIFGFGTDEDEVSDVLRSGEMRLTGVNAQFFSANFEDDRGSEVCPGDSGGPAIITTNNGSNITGVVGVTSFGNRGCGQDGLSAFMNLQGNSVLTFITNTVPGVSVQ